MDNDPSEAISTACAEIGTTPPSSITFDGGVHRYHCPLTDKPGIRDAWYKACDNGDSFAGCVGHWRLNIKRNWNSRSRTEFTQAERLEYARRMNEAREKEQAERQQRHSTARKRADVHFNVSQPADPCHPYLIKKGVGVHGIRQNCSTLLIPITAVFMLKDYNFSKVRVTTGTAAAKRLNELYNDGPFQVVGIECSFQFKKKGKPIFPVRIDEAESLPGVRLNFNTDGIIYPKSGKSNLTMPEYWVAKRNGIIDKIIVHRVIEFEKLDTNWLSVEILELLKLRKDSNESDKLFYKNILNFFYGKTAQGVKASATAIKTHNFDKFVNISSMTCYPLASYITGFCRATVGELLQHNKCYAITTDGFLTPVSRKKLVINDGDLCDQVQSKANSKI
jgi:hypothetical protein